MGERFELERFLKDQIAAGTFPGASYLVSEGGRVLAEDAFGMAVLLPERLPASTSTLYDLASLTKPLSTALLALQLQSEGQLNLEMPLSRMLPGWRTAPDREGVSLLDLLTHRSGLPGWAPLYIHARDRDGRIAWMTRVPLACPPGTQVIYSDLGSMLAGFALEALTGQPLDLLFHERVSRPLGLDDLLYRPGPARQRLVAATELGNERERLLAGPEGAGYNEWRTGMIWGEVHDFNAQTLGGVAGHAGLFGTARAVWRVARAFLGDGKGVVPESARPLFSKSLTVGLAEERAAGFQMASTPGCSAGEALSRGSYGHTGFTGTSLWIDPERGRVYVLLTNRVHPRFHDISMNAIRREFHDLAAAL